VTTLQAMTSDVYNHIARTRLLTLFHLTNPQGLAFMNHAIRLSPEFREFESLLDHSPVLVLSMKELTSSSISESSVYAAYIVSTIPLHKNLSIPLSALNLKPLRLGQMH
jgi:hypothetical protein